MQIHGWNKTTLLDYPGRLAATLFTGACNFRCPFCHNKTLVLNPGEQPVIPEQKILSYLDKRKGILEGICITGGEPTLQTDLIPFIQKIKDAGYLVKLDTNGYRPDILKTLTEMKLLDYIAMDIKSDHKSYSKASGLHNPDLRLIESSAEHIIKAGIEYEFRTTVVKELHTEDTFKNIGAWLKGCRAYYLQQYRDSDQVLSPGMTPHSITRLKQFQEILLGTIDHVEIRGDFLNTEST